MSFILIEGVDRSGKSSVAEMYRKQGYEVVHMDAPDKKYFAPGYSGPSYFEEIVDMYNTYSGKDVVFDRTVYGESLWPHVFNRQAMLTEEDLEYLQKLEYNNEAVRYLMVPNDIEAHWQRCVDNKEPINRMQFVQASRLYEEFTTKYSFEKKTLEDFAGLKRDIESTEESCKPKADAGDVSMSGVLQPKSTATVNVSTDSLEDRLERANAIRSLLKSPIVKKKGEVFKELESNIKQFLSKELEDIFSEPKEDDFTASEVQILKLYVQRIQEKMK